MERPSVNYDPISLLLFVYKILDGATKYSNPHFSCEVVTLSSMYLVNTNAKGVLSKWS